MKLLSMRISALLLALLMILVCVGCGAVETDPDNSSTGVTKDPTTNPAEEESDPAGNGSETVDDAEQVTKENTKEKLSDACNKFVALTAAKLTVVSDNNGEAFTDIVYAFKDANENTVVYMENEVMNGNKDYSYMVGKSEYAKYHYTDEIYCYETEEDISMELLLDEIMMGESSDVIDAFCKTDFEIQKSGSGYEFVLKTTDAVAFFSIFMGEETAQDKYGNITGFEGCVAFAMDADGNFTKTEVKANMKNEDTTATQSVTCGISEHNNKGIVVAEPDWVTEYKNN